MEKKNYYLTRVPDNEAIYHNMYYDEKNKKMYFYLHGRNKKYVNEDGYEVILDKNDKVVYDPLNTELIIFTHINLNFQKTLLGMEEILLYGYCTVQDQMIQQIKILILGKK